MNKYRLRAYAYLIIVAAIWGAAGPVIKFTLRGIDPMSFLAYRFSISAIISIVYFSIVGINFSTLKNSLILIVFYGLLATTISLGLLFSGLDKSSVLDLTLIAALSPLVVTAGGAIFFHDHITKREKIGIMIVLVGVVINAFSPLFFNNSNLRLTGNIFILSFLISDSSSILLAKQIVRRKVKPVLLTNIAFIVGACTMIPIAIYTRGAETLLVSIITMPFKYHLGVWYMAVMSGSIAYFFYVRGQKSIEVSEAALFSYLQPLFSVPLAIIWLGESITTSFIVGAILITLGIIIAEHKRRSRSQR